MENNTMTLQMKMVKIRAEIPALIKRAYSEEVNYDFTKIDDIFRYLTPAMNRWKVNMDIVSEAATKKDAAGNPQYLEYFSPLRQWLYEAELTVRWINAEDPVDVSEVTLHAIGTHEMPEKAKGSAWTYTLKYYLLDKYCIDQGGEDPDMRRNVPLTDENPGEDYEEAGDEIQTFEEAEQGCDKVEEGTEPETGEDYDADLASEPESYMDPEQNQDSEISGEEPVDTRQVSELIRPEQGEPVSLPGYVQQNQNTRSQSTQRQETSRQHTQIQREYQQNAVNQAPLQDHGWSMSLEDAENVVCNIGIHKGERLGDLALGGDEGVSALKWLANSYRGKNETMRAAARILLEAAADEAA